MYVTRGAFTRVVIKVYDYMLQQRSWQSVKDIRAGLGYPPYKTGEYNDKTNKRIRRVLESLVDEGIIEKEGDVDRLRPHGYHTNYYRTIRRPHGLQR